MQKRRVTADTIVGLFVLLALICFVMITFVIRQDLFGRTVTIQATFESVSGLEYGSPVLVSGIRNGRVSSIRYDNEPVRNGDLEVQPVVVTMVVSDDIPIYTNARIRLVQQGFIGDRRVEIDPGSPEGGTLVQSGDAPMRGEPQFDMEEVFRKADDIATDLRLTVASFREVTTDDENIAAIRDTINNLNQSVQKVYDYLETNEDNVQVAMANIRDISEDMRLFSERARIFMEEGGRMDRISADAEQTLSDFRSDANSLVGRVETLVETMNETVARVDQRSRVLTDSATDMMDSAKVDFNALSGNLQTTSTNLNDIIVRIKRGEGTVGRLMVDPQPFEDLKASISALHEFLLGGTAGDTAIPYRSQRPEGKGDATE